MYFGNKKRKGSTKMNYCYDGNTLNSKLELDYNTIHLAPLDLLNIILSVPTDLVYITDINEFIANKLLGTNHINTQLIDFDIVQNKNFTGFMGYDKDAKEFRQEIANIKELVERCILPHKEKYTITRKGIQYDVTRKIDNIKLYNNIYSTSLFCSMQSNIGKLSLATPKDNRYLNCYNSNSIIPFIYMDLLRCINENITLSKCNICNKYFISKGRIGKTGNKYCSKECSNVMKKEQMRKRRQST